MKDFVSSDDLKVICVGLGNYLCLLFTKLIDYLLYVIDSRLYLLVTSFVLYIKQLIGRWWCIIPLFSPRSHYTSAVISPSFMDRLSFLYVSTSILPYNPFQRLLPCNSNYIACQVHVFQPYTSCMVSSGKQSKSNKGPGNSPPLPNVNIIATLFVFSNN